MFSKLRDFRKSHGTKHTPASPTSIDDIQLLRLIWLLIYGNWIVPSPSVGLTFPSSYYVQQREKGETWKYEKSGGKCAENYEAIFLFSVWQRAASMEFLWAYSVYSKSEDLSCGGRCKVFSCVWKIFHTAKNWDVFSLLLAFTLESLSLRNSVDSANFFTLSERRRRKKKHFYFFSLPFIDTSHKFDRNQWNIGDNYPHLLSALSRNSHISIAWVYTE